jgi:hypothetical protein
MRIGRLKAGLAVAAVFAGLTGMAIQPAFADYAPNNKDVVGVGSDTVQYAMDFVADGDPVGDPGYNTGGNKFKLINFDATADANARLAYGPQGVGNNLCGPGDGPAPGTGNTTGNHQDQPCTLNPTIVLQAGFSPVQRPNGSGAGANALANDSGHLITYARASSCEGPTCTSGGAPKPGPLSSAFDSVQLGTDPLAMLTATTTNAPPLSTAQLKLIYNCTDTLWSQVGGTGAGAGDTIIPIIPQVGSGTRSTFLSAIGLTVPGSCVVTGEENDPAAIGGALSQGGVVTAGTSDPQDAIEPMSGGRLNLFLGLLSDGSASAAGPYFHDPSCSLNAIATSTPSACSAANNPLKPAVKLVTTGATSDGGTAFLINRPLYIYFRHSDVTSTAAWQPGGTLNAVRSLFYNPCLTGQTGCVTVGGMTFGPGGPPFIDTAPGQADISAAGIVPAYIPTPGGP